MREDIYICVDTHHIDGGAHVYLSGEERDTVAFDDKTFYVAYNQDEELWDGYFDTKENAIKAAYKYAAQEAARLNCDWGSNE